MSIPYAFVTLLTSDAYLPGALTVAAALKDVHLSLPSDQTVEYETVCLVTPETVDITTIRLLRKAFDMVVGVEAIVAPDTESLTLLGRADLDSALTKLHVFRLTQYSKVIFLDADVLTLRPLSHLFHIDHEFSAVPDVGWPDIFNSGVMVLSPGEDKFEELQELLNTKGTWDGADQGLLNEWRGGNWNRLSFTYNTTPTATYTYAPAYKRFGPQIAVIHFIGPHKPWHSIAYRALGPPAQPTDMAIESSTETNTTRQPAYDYGSLIDRWYSVYDRHYRSRVVETVFQPDKYSSAWNEEGLRHTMTTGGVLGLEELRRMALEGMEASGISATRADGEGGYRSMPLEGRFDLTRPQTRAERKQIQVPADRTETPESTFVPMGPSATTPEPVTPPAQILTLPSGSPMRWTTLPTPEIHEIPPAPQTRLMSLPPTPLRYVSTPYKPLRKTREAGAQTQIRDESGATDASQTHPLSVGTPVTLAPMDTYFPKVWDIDRNWSSISPSSETSLTTIESSPSKLQPTSATFFCPSVVPAASATPEARHGKYRRAIGGESESPTLDPTKVKRIFPWEARPRHTRRRVFPDETPPTLTTFANSPVSATPRKKGPFRSPIPSPLAGFPPSLRSHPSDDLFSQKHAGGVSLPIPSSSHLGLEIQVGRVETSSQDGDIEDEVDSEDERVMRSRTRSSSIGMTKRTMKYRSIGVQTDPRELREEGIQATVPAYVAEEQENSILMDKHLKRAWLTTTGTTTHVSTFSPLSRSTSDSHDPLSPLLSRNSTTWALAERDDRPSPSSIPSSSPAGGPSVSRFHKGSRVWDPARGIEAFKLGSEEVLAKFMKVGH